MKAFSELPVGVGAPAPMPAAGSLPHILVNDERCVGCQECVIRCPTGALDIDEASWKAVGNDDACVGCRQCVRTCPYGAILVEGPMRVGARVEVPTHSPSVLAGDIASTRPGLGYAEAMREAERCLLCPDPTCVLGCPAHNDIPAFIAAVRDEDFDLANAVLHRTSVMPDICSIVCDQSVQCEGACSWKLAGGEPVAIGMLERFVTEQSPVPEVQAVTPQPPGARVAVVGSGPAGMAAAWEFLENGTHVTMFEREGVTGGVLSWGIPDFTLPDRIARRPMEALKRAGLEVRTHADVDETELERLRRDYDAVVLAQGASNPSRLPVPGADAEGVEDATRFLRRAKLALLSGARRLDDLGEGTRLLVVGAGNTAMDVARSARRLGCEVTAIDWFDRRFAAVREDELLEAEHEGVTITFNRVVERFEVDDRGRVQAAHLRATRQPRASRRPRTSNGPAERLELDHVVLATGYRVGGPVPSDADAALPVAVPELDRTVPERTLMGSGLVAGSAGLTRLVRRRAYLEARAARPLAASLWAAGDGLSGPSTVVGSMAQGLAAARAVLSALAERDEPASTSTVDDRGNERVTGGHGRRREDARQPSMVLRAGGWVPKAMLASGLILEVAGIAMGSATRDWIPAAVLLVVGAVTSLAGLNGWVGGWVRAQDG